MRFATLGVHTNKEVVVSINPLWDVPSLPNSMQNASPSQTAIANQLLQQLVALQNALKAEDPQAIQDAAGQFQTFYQMHEATINVMAQEAEPYGYNINSEIQGLTTDLEALNGSNPSLTPTQATTNAEQTIASIKGVLELGLVFNVFQ